MPAHEDRVGIMQPYFFPYLGHFALIASVDRWVVFDVPQYTPKTWMNRNRVLHPAEEWMYVTVPVKGGSRNRSIQSVMLHRPDEALESIRGKLAHYRRKAPYFERVVSLLESAFERRANDSLVGMNVSALQVVCDYLGLAFNYAICSEMGLELSDVEHAGQWALKIATQLGAREYLNPVGGSTIFDPNEFQAAGVRLGFLEIPAMTYDTAPYRFIPNLSILDVLMWTEPSDVKRFLVERAIVVPGERHARAR